jgi:hypothetical protein
MATAVDCRATSRHFASLLFCAFVLASCAGRTPPPVAPVQAVQLMPEERLGIDDVFEVRVFAEPDLSGAYRISADGTIDFALIGRPCEGRAPNVILRPGDILVVEERLF